MSPGQKQAELPYLVKHATDPHCQIIHALVEPLLLPGWPKELTVGRKARLHSSNHTTH